MKLNKAKKEEILKKLLFDKEQEMENSYFQEKQDFADEWYQEYMLPFLPTIKKLPDFCKIKTTTMRFEIRYNQNLFCTFKQPVLFSNSFVNPRPIIYVDDDIKYKQKYEIILQNQKKRNEVLNQLYHKIEGVLSQFNTSKQIKDYWPEVYQELGLEDEDKKSLLPAIPTKELNKLLGLPKPKRGERK